MNDDKTITSQICDYQNIVNHLAKEGDVLPERYKTQCLVEKLPESWRDYKLNYRQKRKPMIFQETIVHIKIEEKNRLLQVTNRAKVIMSKANVVDGPPSLHKIPIGDLKIKMIDLIKIKTNIKDK